SSPSTSSVRNPGTSLPPWADRHAYAGGVDADDDVRAALSCLTTLLDGSHRASPDRLVDVGGRAGLAMGWELTVHPITVDQRRLVPLAPEGDELGLDSPAGQAFRTMRPVHDAGTTWAPLLDGVERLGTLRAVTQAPGR